MVQPVELVFPPDRTAGRDRRVEHRPRWSPRRRTPTVAALDELGYEVPATLVVAGTVEGTDAEGKVEEGDVIVALDGTAVPDYQS